MMMSGGVISINYSQISPSYRMILPFLPWFYGLELFFSSLFFSPFDLQKKKNEKWKKKQFWCHVMPGHVRSCHSTNSYPTFFLYIFTLKKPHGADVVYMTQYKQACKIQLAGPLDSYLHLSGQAPNDIPLRYLVQYVCTIHVPSIVQHTHHCPLQYS